MANFALSIAGLLNNYDQDVQQQHARQQAQAAANAWIQALRKHPDHPEQAIAEIRGPYPEIASRIETQLDAHRKAALEQAQGQTALLKAQYQALGPLFANVTDPASFAAVQQQAQRMVGPDQASVLMGDQFDPATTPERLKTALLDSQQRAEAAAKATEAAQKALDAKRSGAKSDAELNKLQTEQAAHAFGLATDDDSWQHAAESQKALGVRPEILAQFGDHYTPDAPQRALQLISGAPKEPASDYGRFESDYLKNAALKKGSDLTPADIITAKLEARKAFGQADDRPSVTIQQGAQQLSDVAESVKGMKDGTIPPQLPGRASKDYTAIMAEAHRQGYDLAKAAQDWQAQQKYLATLNGAQQTRLRQAIRFTTDSLDVIDDLNTQWKGGRFPMLNKANLALAKNGALGKEAQAIATKLDAQIADLVSELGTVYKGGNSSTDESLKLAAKNLSADWSQSQLASAVDLARQNLKIRANSMNALGAVQAPGGAAPAAIPTQPKKSVDELLKLYGGH